MNYVVLIVYIGICIILGGGSTALYLYFKMNKDDKKIKDNIPPVEKMLSGEHVVN